MQKNNVSLLFGIMVFGIFAAGVGGCKPDYPSCDTDTDCKEKNEFCVNKKCQQCRDAKDCRAGQSCEAGKCSAIPGYCTDKSMCPSGQECIANRCRPCSSDSECASGLKCLAGACAKPQCTKDEDCAQDQECQNSACVPARKKALSGPPCPLAPVYFGFDQATISSESTAVLSSNVECLKKADRAVNLVGRADSRGTPEYNLALSDRRSQSVKEYYQRTGIAAGRLIPVPRGELDSAGSDDASMAKDRRVDSEWQ